MIGLLIIAHDRLGDAFRDVIQHFFPDNILNNVRVLGVTLDQQHDDIIEAAKVVVEEIDAGNGVLVLTDIFGATPCNAARKLVSDGKIAMLTGVNAPMIVKATQYAAQSHDLTAFTESVKNAGVGGILAITTPPEGHC